MTDAGPDEDLSHPIPRLDTYDVLLRTDSGARVGIVIATPLGRSPRDFERFERKMQLALSFFESDEFRQRWGTPTPQHCAVYITVHSASDSQAIDLVFSQADRIRSAGLKPVIKIKDAN